MDTRSETSIRASNGRNYNLIPPRILQAINLEGVKLATSINGTLNDRTGKDRGWSLEVSIPWVNFQVA